MRCSICLEEMDHPANRTFSCPRKNQPWHTREYRKVRLEYEMSSDSIRDALAEKLEEMRAKS